MRVFLGELDEGGELVHVERDVSTRHEIAALARKLDGRPVIFEHVRESKDYRVVAGVCSSRSLLAKALGVEEKDLLHKILEAIKNPNPVSVVDDAPCQEVVENDVDLYKIPVLTHYEKDGGPYVTASVVIANDKEYGYNASYHRLMLLGKERVAARILPRHLDEYIRRGNRDIAVSIGNHPAFLLASGVSCEVGKSELAIANRLRDTRFVKCTTSDILVPADCELVLEGVVTDELIDEGPFPDITGTYDIIRKQRVFKINRITHRKSPIYQALLPGGTEHKLLMGMPREPTVFREVSKTCECLDVRLTLGGCSWLHAVVKIRKQREEDGRNALEAAFNGHPSLKHVVVVDEDIDIDDPTEVEWAVATRAQMDRSLVLKPGEHGSSLDPSADQVTRITCKAGLDATIPLHRPREKFTKAKNPLEDQIRVEDYL